MNIMFVLIGMCLLCGVIGLYIGVGNTVARRCSKGPERKSHKHAIQLESLASAPGKKLLLALSAIVSLSLAIIPANAQEVIHARAGKVIAFSKASKTITLKASDGTTVLFADVPASKQEGLLAKEFREKTVPAETFDRIGDQVVIFYFGFNNPSAVAIKDLGTGTIKRNAGSVASFERHQRLLVVKTDAVEPQKVVVTDDTVVDTPDGIIKPADYHPSKGEQVRLISAVEKDSQAALLIGPN